MILVDCGTGEESEVRWLVEQGLDVIIADHHRIQTNMPDAFAWIHPGMSAGEHHETPCGSVMAFKLAEALWRSFIGSDDPAASRLFSFRSFGFSRARHFGRPRAAHRGKPRARLAQLPPA